LLSTYVHVVLQNTFDTNEVGFRQGQEQVCGMVRVKGGLRGKRRVNSVCTTNFHIL